MEGDDDDVEAGQGDVEAGGQDLSDSDNKKMIDVMPSRCWELFGGYEEIGTLDKPPLPALQQ